MRRNLLSSIVAAALLPAGFLCAAPGAGSSPAQYLSQIDEQTYQIQTQADRLERFVRSGAHGGNDSAGYTYGMTEGAQKLLALLDQIAAQPSATNDTRLQVKKMKLMTAELMAFSGDAFDELETPALALHAENVVANTANIEARCNMIRGAAQDLFVAR